jgi:hypothetical protein
MLKLIKITESLFQQAMQVSINGGNQDWFMCYFSCTAGFIDSSEAELLAI